MESANDTRNGYRDHLDAWLPTRRVATNQLRRMYPGAIITRKGEFALVHLDSPSAEEQAKRTAEFDPAKFWADDCPLCVESRRSGIVVYDDREDRA